MYKMKLFEAQNAVQLLHVHCRASAVSQVYSKETYARWNSIVLSHPIRAIYTWFDMT